MGTKRPPLKLWIVVFTSLFILSNIRATYFSWPDFEHWSYGFPLFWLTHQLSSFAGPVDRWLFDSVSLAVNTAFWAFMALVVLAVKTSLR